LGCETSRIPHFLDNRLTDGGEVVSPTRRQAALYPPGTFLVLTYIKRLSRPQCPSAAGRIKSTEKFSELIGNGTRDLLAFSVMRKATTPQRAPCSQGVKGRKYSFSGRILFHTINKLVARVSFRALNLQFAVHKATAERCFSKYFGFPLPVNILPLAPFSHM
jgi:hypothetical protein